MTIVCGGGSSTTRPGVPPAIVIDAAYAQSLLPTTLAVLYPYLPFMHGLQVEDVATFCSLDPPSWSVPTAAEFYSFLTGGPVGYAQTVNQFLVDLTRYFLWYRICQCGTGSPTAPTNPTLPTSLPEVNPPNVVGPQVGVGCATYEAVPQSAPWTTGATRSLFGDYTGGTFHSGVPLPAGATSVVLATQIGGSGPVTFSLVPVIRFFNAAGTGTGFGSNSHSGSPPQSLTSTIAVPAGSTQFTLSITEPSTGTNPNETLSGTVTFYCGTTPGSTVSPCCPPDPVATGLLTQIYNLLTLQQRQTNPFAYISGSSHAGLTGSGTLSVQGILGVLLNVSSLEEFSVDFGTPDTYYGVGFLRFGTADGYAPEIRIDTDSQVVFPESAGVYTVIAYNLSPGAIMTLTELIREP